MSSTDIGLALWAMATAAACIVIARLAIGPKAWNEPMSRGAPNAKPYPLAPPVLTIEERRRLRAIGAWCRKIGAGGATMEEGVALFETLAEADRARWLRFQARDKPHYRYRGFLRGRTFCRPGETRSIEHHGGAELAMFSRRGIFLVDPGPAAPMPKGFTTNAPEFEAAYRKLRGVG